MKDCHCIIRHAKTEIERKRVIQALSYARSVRDTLGITLALAQLGECASKKKDLPPVS